MRLNSFCYFFKLYSWIINKINLLIFHVVQTRQSLLNWVSCIDVVFLLEFIKYYFCYGAKWLIYYRNIQLNRICRRRQIIHSWFNDQSGQDLQRNFVPTSKSAITPKIPVGEGTSIPTRVSSERIPFNDLRGFSNFNPQYNLECRVEWSTGREFYLSESCWTEKIPLKPSRMSIVK